MAYTTSVYKKREPNNFSSCRAVSVMEVTGENIGEIDKKSDCKQNYEEK
jgi:hypothetical protein